LPKLKVAAYWAADCGGCGVAILDINERILALAEAADIVFWPLALDPKVEDVKAMKDKEIDVCLFSGAIRNDENHEMAELLRRKSKILISFGSCACFGGIPALANLFTREEILRRVYLETESTNNPEKIYPRTHFNAPEGELDIPEFYDHVYTLDQVVDVEYYIPGCAPLPDTIWAAVSALIGGAVPPKGTIFAGSKTLCDECSKVKQEKKITDIKRPIEIMMDSEKCLLEQELICLGPVTRGGCGGRCTAMDMPCRGCFGPTEGSLDQGAKLIGTIGSLIDSNDPGEIKRIVDKILDPAGTFYRFTLAGSMLQGKRREGVS
jgi:F420-non-reducing hydrogenase small subunit